MTEYFVMVSYHCRIYSELSKFNKFQGYDVIEPPKKGGSGSKLVGDFFLVNLDYKTGLKTKFRLCCNLFLEKSYFYWANDRFSWSDHIIEICSKLSQVAGIILKVRS